MNDETLPEQEFNLELPNLDDDGKIKPFIRPADSGQAVLDISEGKIPAVVVGVSIDF